MECLLTEPSPASPRLDSGGGSGGWKPQGSLPRTLSLPATSPQQSSPTDQHFTQSVAHTSLKSYRCPAKRQDSWQLTKKTHDHQGGCNSKKKEKGPPL